MKKHDTQTAAMFKTGAATMPEGYYSGDKPNPNLRAFVESHVTVYNPDADDYEITEAFAKPLDIDKRKTPITDLHIYWSKKHPEAIRDYIEHYTKPGDLILDPFCGSGMAALVALGLGRHAIVIDRSPAATFITKNYCTSVDAEAVRAECHRMLAAVKARYGWLYETRCERCGGPAEIAYMVYSFTTQCIKCLKTFPIFDLSGGNKEEGGACPKCGEPVTGRMGVNGYVPVEASYICRGRCKPKRSTRSLKSRGEKAERFFKEYDVAKIHEVEKKPIPFAFPQADMPEVTCSHRLYPKGLTHFKDIYTHRNLWALCALFNEIRTNTPEYLRDALLFIMGTVVFPTSKMCRHEYPSVQNGTYYVPLVGRELSVFENFEGRINRKCDGLQSVASWVDNKADLIISTQSACDLSAIPANSIDYVFTDPPYGDKVPFWELNLIWEYWWGFNVGWEHDEVIVNPRRGKSEEEWQTKMQAAFQEMYRVLKPGRWLSLCYHDTSEMTWEAIQDLAAEVGFHPDTADTAIFIEVKQKTFKQLREREGERVAKRDLVVNFRKPLPDEVGRSALVFTGQEDVITFRDKAAVVITKYLADNPGAPRDRIYDVLVSYLIRRGDMERHNFDELLHLFAEPGGNDPTRWYLKADYEIEADTAEAQKEANAVTRLLPVVQKYLEEYGDQEGIRYSDLFEAYLYTILSKDKPRREFKEFILDYFVRTADGAYRPACDENESESLALARRAGTNRRIRRFLNYLANGVSIPERERPNDATLAEWLRHCKRIGLYEQGKLLYERGGLDLDHLPEEVAVNVEEDYQVCVRLLTRTGEGKGERRKGKKAKGEREKVKGEREN